MNLKKMDKKYNNLKVYQKYRDKCNYSEEKIGAGMWCNLKNIKCSYINCNNFEIRSPKSKKQKLGYHKNLINGQHPLSNEQKKIIQMKENGASFRTISKEIKKDVSYIYKQYKKSIRVYKGDMVNNKPIGQHSHKGVVNTLGINLHNELVAVEINPCDFICEKTIKLKYTEYLIIKDEEKHIQVFKNGKLTVRFKRDIRAKTIDEARAEADNRLRSFLSSFGYKGINFVRNGEAFNLLQRDYAITGTDIAEKWYREKRKLFVFDKEDLKCRLEIDFSEPKKPHFEHPHTLKGYDDAKHSEEFWQDYLDKPHYKLSETKEFIDGLAYTQGKMAEIINELGHKYAENLKLHIEVQRQQLKNAISMDNTLKKIQKAIKK